MLGDAAGSLRESRLIERKQGQNIMITFKKNAVFETSTVPDKQKSMRFCCYLEADYFVRSSTLVSINLLKTF